MNKLPEEPTTKDPQVIRMLASAEKSIERLAHLMGDLETRLAMVLQDCPPSDIGRAENAESFVPLAETIHQLNSGISNQCYHIESILARLEL